MIWFVSALLVIVLIFGAVVFKGSPYLPSQKKYLRLALSELYPLAKQDVLVDVGSGDGVVLREASRIGARAIGFEINPILVCISRLLSNKDQRVEVRFADFWSSHLPDETTVMYVFSVVRDMRHMGKWIQSETDRIGRAISIVSYGSKFDEKKPTKSLEPYYLYVFRPLHQVKPQV